MYNPYDEQPDVDLGFAVPNSQKAFIANALNKCSGVPNSFKCGVIFNMLVSEMEEQLPENIIENIFEGSQTDYENTWQDYEDHLKSYHDDEFIDFLGLKQK